MPTAAPEEFPTYEVRIVLKARSHPNRWMSMVLQDALDDNEELIHVTVAEVEGV